VPAVWKSSHPDVLAWWEDVQKREKRYVRECRKVEKSTGRQLMLRTGFGDDYVAGLSRKYNEDPPEGWKYAEGGRKSHYFEPRYTPNKEHSKEACEQAQALIKKLNDLRVGVRGECHERFHTPVFQMFGLHAISPGFFEHEGVLWVTFGTHDYDPDGGPMTKFFKPAKQSEYYAAREAAGLEEAV
jgi:hypothetical protein